MRHVAPPVLRAARAVCTSPKGITWTTRASDTTNTILGATWGGGQFVAVVNDGTILTSPDGQNWTSRSSGTTATLFRIDCSSGQFVVTGAAGTLLTSPLPPFQSWSLARFSAPQMFDPAVGGPSADPDGDGLSNLTEYALGREPKVAEAAPASVTSNDGTDWIFTYTRPADRSDVTYAVEVSTDLATWTTSGVTHARTVAGATETWQGRVAMAGRPQVFFRLKVSQP